MFPSAGGSPGTAGGFTPPRVASRGSIVQGGSDLHVPPRSAERLAQALRAAGDRDVAVRIIPHLSHTLCPDTLGSIQAWSWLPSRRLSNQLLDALASWLTAELKPGKLRAP